jgi:hypothetical protein
MAEYVQPFKQGLIEKQKHKKDYHISPFLSNFLDRNLQDLSK